MLALAAADRVPRGSRHLAYAEGGAMLALGLWQSIANLAGWLATPPSGCRDGELRTFATRYGAHPGD